MENTRVSETLNKASTLEMDRCDSCSFVYADVNAPAIPAQLAAFGIQYTALLLPPGRSAVWFDILRTRPAEGVWSALEYACHVRDVFLVQRDRLYTALVEETPTFTPMYRDQRVTLARYNVQNPEEVATQLATAAQLIAQAFQALDAAQFQRRCIYNFPAPTERSLLWVGQHMIHEGEHHFRDIERGIAHVRAMAG
jgi:S-DNA-T family DNA segregation ATPase FtsK/SpoIIIE